MARTVRLGFALSLAICAAILANAGIEKLRKPATIDKQTVVHYETPEVPSEHRGLIVWLPKVGASGVQSPVTDDGKVVYLLNHKQGWMDCLESFHADVKYGNESLWSTQQAELITIGGPQHWNSARIDGWLACQMELKGRLATSEASELRGTLDRNLAELRKPTGYAFLGIGALLGIVAFLVLYFPQGTIGRLSPSG